MRERSVKLSEEHYQRLLSLKQRGTAITLRLPMCEILERAVDLLYEHYPPVPKEVADEPNTA